MTSSTVPHLLRFPAPVPARLKGGVVTLGNFDGVHLGHRHVIKALKEAGGIVLVLWFLSIRTRFES